MKLGHLANRFAGRPARKPPPAFLKGNGKKKAGGRGVADLDAYRRTYGEKDGRTVFDAAQIKVKRKGKR